MENKTNTEEETDRKCNAVLVAPLPVCAHAGITQEQIDECRGAKEALMLADIRAMGLSGADLNAQDDNGVTLVSNVRLWKTKTKIHFHLENDC